MKKRDACNTSPGFRSGETMRSWETRSPKRAAFNQSSFPVVFLLFICFLKPQTLPFLFLTFLTLSAPFPGSFSRSLNVSLSLTKGNRDRKQKGGEVMLVWGQRERERKETGRKSKVRTLGSAAAGGVFRGHLKPFVRSSVLSFLLQDDGGAAATLKTFRVQVFSFPFLFSRTPFLFLLVFTCLCVRNRRKKETGKGAVIGN